MGTKEINITTQYLLRPLGLIGKEERLSESILGQMDFIRAFIGDVENEEDYICPVFLLFSDRYVSVLTDFIESEYLRKKSEKRGLLVKDYDYPGYIVLIYEFPENYRADYNKITFGKYSKTSEWFKHWFSAKDKDSGTHSRNYFVLDKSPDFRRSRERTLDVIIDEDVELEDVMNLDNSDKYTPNELLDINDFL